MSRQRILESWNEFARVVLPSNVGQTQMIETRRAFFAGAIALFDIVTRTPEVVGADHTMDDGMKVFDEIAAEIKLYADRLRSGAM